MVIFHCHVSLLEGTSPGMILQKDPQYPHLHPSHHFLLEFKDAESAFRGLRDTVGEARRMGGFVGVVYILEIYIPYIPWGGCQHPSFTVGLPTRGFLGLACSFASLKFTPRQVPNGWRGGTRWQPLPEPPQSKFCTMAKNDMTAEISNSSLETIREEVMNYIYRLGVAPSQ